MKNKKALVFGSGASGLIVSSYLVKEGCDVVICDPYKDYKVQTLYKESGLVELAANSLLYNEEVNFFLDHIGLEYEFYSDLGKRKYICIDGKIKRWPLSFFKTLKNIKTLVKFAKKDPSMKPLEGETLAQWSKRAFSDELSYNLLFPALQGVYGPDVEDLSASLIINKFLNAKKSKKRGSLSFKKGMGEFIEAMKKHLEKKGVIFTEEKANLEDFDFFVVSTPTFSLPDLVSSKNKEIFSKVTYQSMITATVFLKEEERLDMKGFGAVFKNRPKGLSGVILNSDIFDNRAKKGLASETWIFDGRNLEENEVLGRIESLRKEIFNKDSHFVDSHVKKWKRAFPRYDLKLEKALQSLEEQDKIFYFTNWIGLIGLASLIEEGPNFIEKIKRSF